MEVYGLHIVEVEGISVLTHNGKICNPFSERFTKRNLVSMVGSSGMLKDILSTINNHFNNRPKDHYLKRYVRSINSRCEIPGIKESKLNVCKVCFNHCSSNYINPHLKKEHGIRLNFAHHVFKTTGYCIPNQKCGFSYLYREKEEIELAVPMTKLEGPHTQHRHEDKFLRMISANLFYGKGYPQYLWTADLDESTPVKEAFRRYILKDRPHLKGTYPITGC